MKLIGCKSALNPRWIILLTVLRRWSRFYLSLCCFVVYYSTRRFVLSLALWYFVVFFRPFSITITSLGEERANLSAFRTFVRFVWFCLFPLPLGVWEGLRFVIVTLLGLFSYLFCMVPKMFEPWKFENIYIVLDVVASLHELSLLIDVDIGFDVITWQFIQFIWNPSFSQFARNSRGSLIATKHIFCLKVILPFKSSINYDPW